MRKKSTKTTLDKIEGMGMYRLIVYKTAIVVYTLGWVKRTGFLIKLNGNKKA